MSQMCFNCTKLTSIPLFNTSKVTNMFQTFQGCTNVQSGALALYQQMSTQTTPPTNHGGTFYNCGINTQTGSAELAQIPSDWK
jgi:surface protein